MLPSDLIVEVRDATLQRQGQLTADDLTDALFEPTSNEIGVWSITLPHTVVDENTGKTQEHRLCRLLRTPGYGLIVTGPDGVILSGPTVGAAFEASIADPEGSWTIEGVSDLQLIADALAYGDPTTYDLAAQGTANDSRTDDAESLLYWFVDRNRGPAAVFERRNPALTLAANLGRGPTLKKSPRFQNLLELSQEIVTEAFALDGIRLCFDVLQITDHLEFRVWVADDKSDELRFDHLNGQLDRTSYEYAAPDLTEAIVAGGDEGTARVMRRRTGNTGWGRHIETFIDRRNTEDATELDQSGDEALAEAAEDAAVFEIVPNIDLAHDDDQPRSRRLDYGKWVVGDLVTVVIAGEEITVPVASAPIRVSAAGVLVGATLGSLAVDARTRSLAARLSHLERSL
ncbi:Gp37-like protein [Agromyces badenianii]|uniref:Gp37-like protein n=1 Tax=Agromyces badenianii TaxID=2080742 RepID=UPI000D59902F|nr:hypothetical protein [Agromyces badenianii]PWC05414.1 hypothetical protein DCE94_03840 [Agromyces badenianii]